MCEGHKRCTRHPVFRVTVHRIDMCNRPPGATVVYQLCPACMRATAYRLGEIYLGETTSGQVSRCTTCQLWINGLSDVFDVEWFSEVRSA